jgi:hypothetical protein
MLWKFLEGDERLPWLAETKSNIHIVGMGSISIVSLTMQSMYRVLMASIEISWNVMRCPESTQCSATAELSGCSRRMCR